MFLNPTETPTPAKPLAVASDHAGFAVKERVLAWLQAHNVPHADLGVFSEARADYPVPARALASGVAAGTYARGILLCGTGIGMSIAANRRRGVRASLCWSVEVARLTREHNDSNVLVLPARARTLDPVEDILAAWMETPYSHDERHGGRLAMLDGQD